MEIKREIVLKNKIHFDVSVLEYVGSTKWVEPTLNEIKLLLDQTIVPKTNIDCSYCNYVQNVNSVDSVE